MPRRKTKTEKEIDRLAKDDEFNRRIALGESAALANYFTVHAARLAKERETARAAILRDINRNYNRTKAKETGASRDAM